ncbi:MAG TPA: AMP-binding protein [Candidatus Dormibacteraeota bacterium]|nr:AMP-binding protein [Candidatus Dormibacteraeota bacterium]
MDRQGLRDETASPDERLAAQLRRLRAGLGEITRSNPFYREKFAGLDPRDVDSLDDFRHLPFTTKAELVRDQAAHPPFGTNLTYPLDRYIRVHQTSGTTGAPLRVLDTEESWRWWAKLWTYVYRAAGVAAGDRIYFCFGFGPFIGFWSALEGARAIGALAISGGGQTTVERLRGIVELAATVVLCTPTYALRMAEVAREHGIALPDSAVRVTLHAGEPGASIPETRTRIEQAFGARAVDHTGASEVGATGFSCDARDGVHLIEGEFIAEVLDPATGAPVAAGGEGELVLTNLGRWGQPAIRYRTGDRVRPVWERCACGRTFVRLLGGILGRVDDMITVRGVNVFPSAIESIVRRYPEIVEFQIEARTTRGMDELVLQVEARDTVASSELCRRIADALHAQLSLRCLVEAAPPNSLPRYELKSHRLVRRDPERR